VSASSSLAAAVAFIWLGMVLAISFLETPLKFRAPRRHRADRTRQGRLVFRALNLVERVLVTMLLGALLVAVPHARVMVGAALALTVLLVQVAVVRPMLAPRSDRVLAGESPPQSRAHPGILRQMDGRPREE
jgi:hypothetical protein